jgi:formylmethanofuran dehydrogenase subunit E
LFGYNETQAQIYYPLDNLHAKNKGYNRKNEETKITKNIEYNTKDMSDKELLETIFYCKKSGKPFRLIKQEIDFYRKHGLTFPTICFDQRHLERTKKKRSRIIRSSLCKKCGVNIETTNSTDKNIYCNMCYKKEIY